MRETRSEALTVVVFAGGLLASLGLTMALHEDGSGMARGSGVLLVATGLALALCFCRLLRSSAAPVAAAYGPEALGGATHADWSEVLSGGSRLDDRIWRIRM